MKKNTARYLLGTTILGTWLAGCGGDSKVTSGSDKFLATGKEVVAPAADATAVNQLGDAIFIPGFEGVPPSRVASRKYSSPAADGGLVINTRDRDAVRAFYNGLYSQSVQVPMNWTGNYDTGAAGDTDSRFKDATLLRLNWFRAMAGLPANAVFSDAYNAKDQQAALMESVAGQLNHTPPSTWTYYTADAYAASSHSNLALGSTGAEAIDGYMRDPGTNNSVVGHRRWILYPQTTTFGTGDVPGGTFQGKTVYGSNALWTVGNETYNARPAVRDSFVAWPPQGYVPYQTVYGRWSFSYPTANFSSASVSVRKNGVAVPVTVEPITNGFGENTIVWLLSGTTDSTTWPKPTSDDTYSVTIANVIVGGVAKTYTYNVTVFDPATPTQGAQATGVAIPATVDWKSPSPVTVSGVTGATGYELVSMERKTISNAALNTGLSSWTSETSGYAPWESGEFHLYHAQYVDQILTIAAPLHFGYSAKLNFTSRRGYATDAETLLVQISTDDGATWSDIFRDAGSNAPSIPVTQSIELTAYKLRPVKLRIVLPNMSNRGPYFPCTTCGWYISGINFTDTDALSLDQRIAVPAIGGTIQFNRPGYHILYARSQYQNRYYGDYGPAAYVFVNGAVLTGPRANYTVAQSGNGYTITDNTLRDGPQNVTSAVRLDFTDKTLDLNTAGVSAQMYRLYQAAFNRKPDLAGLGFWIKHAETDMQSMQIAGAFIASPEFKSLYGDGIADSMFVTLLYKNVLHRIPQQFETDFWVKQINLGMGRPQVLFSFSESAENKQNVSADIANGIEYVRFQ